jgi:hypothetical protein
MGIGRRQFLPQTVGQTKVTEEYPGRCLRTQGWIKERMRCLPPEESKAAYLLGFKGEKLDPNWLK